MTEQRTNRNPNLNPLALPLNGSTLIEASAGTGKTFSLAGLYLRLIVEERASVREILVMTFTRAATQELRERIRARLADAARIAHAPAQAVAGNAEHEFTQRILANSSEDATALARRLADAAARVDEATIVTIHGFAQRAATENAFESALAFDRDGVSQFALVNDPLNCCFGATPQLNHWIDVTLPEGERTAFYSLDPVAVYGRLEVGESFEDGFVISLFRMRADHVLGDF